MAAQFSAFSPQLFEAVRDYFSPEVKFLTIWHEKQTVAVAVSSFYEYRVLPSPTSSNSIGNSSRPFTNQNIVANSARLWILIQENPRQ